MRCTACGAEVPAQAKFCLECGQPVARDCGRCGAAVPAGAKFCPECGAPQTSAAGGGTAPGGVAPLGYCAGSGRAIRLTDEHFRCLQCEQVFLEAYRFEDKPVCQQCAYTSGMAQKLEAERAETARIEPGRKSREEAERARIEAERRAREEAERQQQAEQLRRVFEQETGFRDNGDGTVTQLRTGLQWMRCSLGQIWDGETCSGEADWFTWDDAHAAANALNRQGGYAGHRDWRLPTKDELSGIVYCSQGREGFDSDGVGGSCRGLDYQRPTIDLRVFPNTPSSFFWSGSPSANGSNLAWSVYFLVGNAFDNYRSHRHHVRLVRGGQ